MADMYHQREQPHKLSQFAKVPRRALDDILIDEDSLLDSKSSEVSESDSNTSLSDLVAVCQDNKKLEKRPKWQSFLEAKGTSSSQFMSTHT